MSSTVSMPQSAGTAFKPTSRDAERREGDVSMPQSAGTAFKQVMVLASEWKNARFNASVGGDGVQA